MKNPMAMPGRVIIITGAGQGIGLATGEMALELGANVVAVDWNKDALAKLGNGHGDRVLTLAGDVADPEFAQAMVAQAVARFGAVHGLVNNAGISRPAMIKKMTLDQWNDVLRVNQTGAFLCLQSVGRQMIAQAEEGMQAPGAIVNVSSNAGRRGSIGQINYSATKSALLGMTLSATQEWAKHGIRTNSVCFGTIETPMTETIRGEKFRDKAIAKIPLGRWGKVEEAATVICFMLSEASSFIAGQQLSIDGGSYLSA